MACSDGVFEDDSNLKGQIECLRTMISDLRVEFEGVTKESSNLSSSLGDTWNVLKDMKGTIQSMKDKMWEFTKSAKLQYELGEKIAKSYKETALHIGLSTERSVALSKEFKGALAEVSKFGGDLGDVQQIYKDFAESSGRVRILNDNEVSNIFKLGEATNLYGDQATNLYETLDLMGISNEEATLRMVELVAESQSIGLNSSKVTKMMSSNMKTMQAYSFVGGVKGMTEMAKQAVKMRIDVRDVLQMADKFYQPEAALEAAANLQMLGGDIAKAFGDPFKTMYLARNKPEELAKMLGEMTENMLQFNDVTKEYELPAEARMQLKAAGEQLGINVDSMVEMARQSSKMKDVKMQLSGTAFSDEELEGIASLARMEDGEFKVDFRDANGEKMQKSIDELSAGDVEMLLKAPESEIEYMDEMLYEAQTSNSILENIYKSFEYGFVADMDYYKTVENLTKESIVKTAQLGAKSKEVFGKTGMGGMMSEGGAVFDTMTRNINNKLTGFLDKIAEEINLTDLNVEKIDDMIINNDNLNINAPIDTSARHDPDTSIDPVNKKLAEPVISHTTFDDLNVNIHVDYPDHVTPELAQAIARKAVQRLEENGGVSTGKESITG